MLARLAARGLGVAVLPESVPAQVEGLHPIALTRPRLRGRLALAWRADGPSTPPRRPWSPARGRGSRSARHAADAAARQHDLASAVAAGDRHRDGVDLGRAPGGQPAAARAGEDQRVRLAPDEGRGRSRRRRRCPTTAPGRARARARRRPPPGPGRRFRPRRSRPARRPRMRPSRRSRPRRDGRSARRCSPAGSCTYSRLASQRSRRGAWSSSGGGWGGQPVGAPRRSDRRGRAGRSDETARRRRRRRRAPPGRSSRSGRPVPDGSRARARQRRPAQHLHPVARCGELGASDAQVHGRSLWALMIRPGARRIGEGHDFQHPVPAIALRRRGLDPPVRVRRLPGPAGRDDGERPPRARGRLPPHRHREGLRNEAEVGQAIRASGLDRDEVFVTTKCSTTTTATTGDGALKASLGPARDRTTSTCT